MKQNIFTGNDSNFYNEIKNSIQNAQHIDIIVSFLMESGVKLIFDDLKNSNAKIRILTGNYLNITQPQALYLLKQLGENVDLRFYNEPHKSFHPKAYIFHNDEDSEIYVGSSNLSKGALTTSIEWNYHLSKSKDTEDFNNFYDEFKNLFYNHSIIITDEILKEYSLSWIKPKLPFNQIKDDILSEIGDEKVLGKPVGNDREKGKCTYVTKYGLEKAEEMLSEQIEGAINYIKDYVIEDEFLIELALYIKNRDK